jgi:hypothetical protein
MRNLGRDDRAIAAHGTESRAPFLDEAVVRFLALFQDNGPGDQCGQPTAGVCAAASRDSATDSRSSGGDGRGSAVGDCDTSAELRAFVASVRAAVVSDVDASAVAVDVASSVAAAAGGDGDATSLWPVLPLRALCDLRRGPGSGDKLLLRRAAHALGLRGAGSLVKRAMQFGTRLANRDSVSTAQAGDWLTLRELVNGRYFDGNGDAKAQAAEEDKPAGDVVVETSTQLRRWRQAEHVAAAAQREALKAASAAGTTTAAGPE